MDAILIIWIGIAIMAAISLTIFFHLAVNKIIYNNRLRYKVRRERIRLIHQIRMIMAGANVGNELNLLEASLPRKKKLNLQQLLSENLTKYPEHREVIIQILRQSGWINYNIKKVKSNSWVKRIEAAKALEIIAGNDEIKILVRLLEDQREEVRLIAANCLATIGELNGMKAVINAITNSKLGKSRRLLYVLTLIATKQSSLLLPLLEHPQKSIQVVAINALTNSDQREMARHFLGFLESKDLDLKAAAIKGLGQLGYSEATGLLIPLLNDSSWQVRSCAAKALGDLQQEKAIPALLSNLILDESYWVRRNSAKSLVKMGKSGQSVLAQAAMIGNNETQDLANFTLKEIIWDRSLNEGNYYISDEGLVYMTKEQFEKFIVQNLLETKPNNQQPKER